MAKKIATRMSWFRIVASLILLAVALLIHDNRAILLLLVGVGALSIWWKRVYWLPSAIAVVGVGAALLAELAPGTVGPQWLWRGLTLVFIMTGIVAVSLFEGYDATE